MSPRMAGALLVALVVVLVLITVVSAGAAPSREIARLCCGVGVSEATLNVHNGTPHPLIRADVEAAMTRASLVRFQETYPASRAPLLAAVYARPHWRLAFGGVELAIAYDARVWRLVHRSRVLPMPASGAWGPRALQWLVVRHRETGRAVVVGNIHADPGCSAWTRLYLMRANVWALNRNRAVLLGGDANCRGWQGIGFRPDPTDSIDRLLVRGGAFIRDSRRWSRPAFSDHRLHLHRFRL